MFFDLGMSIVAHECSYTHVHTHTDTHAHTHRGREREREREKHMCTHNTHTDTQKLMRTQNK